MVAARGPSVSVAVTPLAPPPPPAAVPRSAVGPAVSVAVTAAVAPRRAAVGPSVSVGVVQSGQLYAHGGGLLKMYARGGQPLRARRRAATLTYPRSYGDFGSYMPGEATTGCPDEFLSQLVPWEGDKVVTDPYEKIDLLDVRGDLIVRAPFLETPPQRFIVQGRPSYTTPTGLIDCSSSAIRTQIEFRDFTVRPLVPSEYSVGIDGHHWKAVRPKLIYLQDGYRARNGGPDGRSKTALHGAYIDRLTYFRIPAARATSEQSHNDDGQLIGCKDHEIIGSLFWGRYGAGGTVSLDGTKAYPDILDNTGVLWGANNDHPETACIQINVASNGDKVENLLISKSWMFGAYFAINAGDPGNDGTLADPWLLGEVSECWGNWADKRGTPPIWMNVSSKQLIITRGGTAQANRWWDGPNVGKEIATPRAAAVDPNPPAAGATLSQISAAASVFAPGTSYYPVDPARVGPAGAATPPVQQPAGPSSTLSGISTAPSLFPPGTSYYPVDPTRTTR